MGGQACPALAGQALPTLQPEIYGSSTRSAAARTAGLGAHQALGGGTCLLGDLGAREHAGDLLAAMVGSDFGNPGCDPLAAVERLFGDQIMALGASRDF